MGNSNIILDTGIFIEYLRKTRKENSVLFKLAKHYNISITSISVYELYAGAVTEKHIQDIENLLFGVDVFFFDDVSAKIAAKERRRLLRSNIQFEIRDLFIASVVIREKLQFATLNVKHFNNFIDISIVRL